MQKICKISCLLLLMLSLSTCNDYLDINTNPNAPENPGDLDLLLADMTATTSYNLVGGGNWTRYAAQWIKHIANNAAPPSNDTYRINTSSANNEWAFSSYAGVLINGERVVTLGTELEQWHHVGIAQILMAHNYALLTDWWGDIPFSEALGRADLITPKFDAQEDVYIGIQQLLDDAINNLASDVAVNVGGGDFYFNGDPAAWTRIAYALKARYLMRLTNAPGVDADAQARAALDALENAMQSPDDVATFPYAPDPGSESPWQQWIAKFATSMQVSNYMINLLMERDDPRLPIIADQNNMAMYVGHINGATPTNQLGDISAIGAYFLDADLDFPLMTFAEQKFIEAEAHFRLGNTEAAEEAYATAIRTHMNRLSGNGEFSTVIETAAQDAYLAANPLNDLEDIITQKYIAAFILSSFEAYNDYRRTGFPSSLTPAQNAEINQIPTRMIYTDTEINNNAQNVPPGITLSSKVWWDGD